MSTGRSSKAVPTEEQQAATETKPLPLFHPGSDRRLQRRLAIVGAVLIATVFPAVGAAVVLLASVAS